MNLNELLINARNDCFRMTNKSYFYINKQVQRHNYNSSNLTENYLGSQLALLIEYYLKGILLPVLDITVPEDNENLKKLSQELTDEQKYRIIVSDDSVYNDLSRTYGNKYKLKQNVIKKLGDESLKIYSHNLFKLASKIISEAKEGKFNKLSKDNTNDYDKYLIEKLTPLLVILDKNEIKNAFPSGRYGHLDGYIADKNTLIVILNKIREMAITISNGIVLDLYDSKSGQEWCIDEYVFFPENLNKIFIQDEIGKNSRVYRYDNGKLFLEYGLEDENKLDEKYYNGYGINHSMSSYNKKDSSLDFFYHPDRNLKVEQGQYVYFIEKDEKVSGFLRTYAGELEEDSIKYSYSPLFEYEREQEIFDSSDKLKSDFEKKFTQELIEYGTNMNMELSQLSKLGKKYIKYLNATEELQKIKRENIGYQRQQRYKRKYKGYKIPKKFQYERPESNEFRNAYANYVGANLSYRIERGHQIFDYIVQSINSRVKTIHNATHNLSKEEKQELKDDIKESFKDVFTKRNGNDKESER